MGKKDQFINELRSNEHIVQIISWDGLVKEWEVKKGIAKISANYVSPANDSVTAARLLKEFGLSGKVVMRRYAGKEYVIFKGHPELRRVFKGTRYSATHPTVVRMAIGPKGVIGKVKGGFVLSVVLCAGVNIFDFFIRDEATLCELLGTMSSDLIKIGVSSIAAAVAGLAAGSVAILSGVAAAPIIVAIGVGILTTLFIDHVDEKTGATRALIQAYEEAGMGFKKAAETISSIPKRSLREYYRWERWMIYRAINQAIQY